MRRRPLTLTLAGAFAFLGFALASAEDETELDTGKLAPEALLCLKLAKKEIIKGVAVENYMELLADGDVAAWNKRRKKDGGKVLDLAGKTWDAKGREDLILKLEGLDLHGADLTNVIFAPGTSFAFSNLEGATFRGSCLEGVKFASVWSFEERAAKQVRSTNLTNADFRDVVWSWCSALDRTVKRAGESKRRESVEAKRRRNEQEQARIMEQLRRAQMGGRGGTDPFAFCDVEGLQVDKDSPVKPVGEDDEADANNFNGTPNARASRTVERLVRAAREGTIVTSIEKLCARRRGAKTKECANPLKSEPALAAAIAAVNSSLQGIETWKAVVLTEQGGRGEEATIVDNEKTVLVIDGPRSVASTPLLVTRGPIFAWRNAVLPLTFSASAIVIKDQSDTQSVLHGRPIFALSERLHGERRVNVETAGTFHSQVIVEVPGVENLSDAEAKRRALLDAKLKDYAHAQGDLWEGSKIYDPVKDTEGTEPEKTIPADVREAIISEVGKKAFDEMSCFKISGNQTQNFQAVISNDPKAIIVIAGNYAGHGSIYTEGPIVFLESKQRQAWMQRCVSKSWVAIKGEPRVGEFTILGKRVDVEAKAKDE
ncbi:MAG: pentapeptide repeat-containing protein [Planctomycetota bacterium]